MIFDAQYERPPIIGCCSKCGRKFCTLPVDLRDHYGAPECGGIVKDLRGDAEDQPR